METINKTVGQIVREDYRAADVFEKYGIDFCCAGKKALEASCVEKGVDREALINELNSLTNEPKQSLSFGDMSLSALSDYIVNTHHKYVEEAGPVIMKYLEKVKGVHGNHNPELYQVYAMFKVGLEELVMHMRKEELMLFPYIKKLEKAKSEKIEFSAPFGRAENPIKVLMQEHEAEGDRYKRIAELTKQYTPPAHACNTFMVCYAKLQEFEKDLHRHIHLENNILFPGAIELEAARTAR